MSPQPQSAQEHLPRKPDWTCGTCDKPWPCLPARISLSAEHDGNGVALGMYMGVCLQEAARDLGDAADPLELYRRFISWVHHPLATREWPKMSHPS